MNEKSTYNSRMTLLEHFSDTFADQEDSALSHLLGQIQAFHFDSDELDESLNLRYRVGLGTEVQTTHFLKAYVENKLNHIVQVTNDDIRYELFIAGIIHRKPRLFLNNPLSILNSQDASDMAMRVWQENFNCTENKSKVLESIENFIGKNKAMNRLSDNIMIVIDELFSNALYNAPVDEDGYRIFKN